MLLFSVFGVEEYRNGAAIYLGLRVAGIGRIPLQDPTEHIKRKRKKF
jgi:hypothetical protein